VLVTLDTTRADHLGSYGYFRDTSPAFDRFADEALTFERLIVPMATTLPTHLSILTSSHPLEHGVLANTAHGGKRFVPAPQLVSFAMVAQRAGYQTAGFVSAAPLNRGSGIEVGFDHFDAPHGLHRRGDRTADAALRWLADRDPERPYFLWVHFYDAHFPFEAPPPYAGTFKHGDGLERFIAERHIHPSAPRTGTGRRDDARHVHNAYDDELLFQDAQLERVLTALRATPGWPRTAVVVAGDHGEGLCQHGEAAHGSTWDEQLHAPLLVRVAGEAPRRIAAQLAAADIVPTLLGRLGPAADEAGLSAFLETALGRDVLVPGAGEQPILSQDTGRDRGLDFFRYALTARGFKYFRIEHDDGRLEERLFDLGADPYELRDVAATFDEVLADMRERTADEIAARRARGEALRGGAARTRAAADPELVRQLCALGYMEGDECEEPAEPAE